MNVIGPVEYRKQCGSANEREASRASSSRMKNVASSRPPGFQHPRDLGRVMFELFRQEIRKQRVRDDHIESSILIRKAKLRCAQRTIGIVNSIADVGDVQGGALVVWHPMFLGPKHLFPLGIEAFIFATAIEIVAQSDCQPPIIAADIEEPRHPAPA